MSTSINTNISSLQAQNSLRSSNLNMSTAMERLSSGVRINSAKDDAAGLAISTRMTANIRGIAAAVRNANDGISLTQTAEGSLSQISDNLQRIRELAVQSSNTGNNASDRAAMNNEASALISEIDRVASNSAFNGIKLLDGSFKDQALQVGVGNDSNDRINISIGSAKSSTLGVGSNSNYSSTVTGSVLTQGAAMTESASVTFAAVATGGTVTIGGLIFTSTSGATAAQVGAAFASLAAGTAAAAANTANATALTAAGTGTFSGGPLAGFSSGAGTATIVFTSSTTFSDVTNLSVAASATGAGVPASVVTPGSQSPTWAAGEVTINGFNVGATLSDGVSSAKSDSSALAKSNAINAVSGQTGVTAKVVATTLTNTATGTAGAFVLVANGVTVSGTADATAAGAASNIAAAFNAVSAQTGIVATLGASGAYTLTAVDGRNIDITATTGGTLSGTSTATTFGSINLSSTGSAGIVLGGIKATAAQIGAAAGVTTATATAGAGVSSLDLSTASGSQAALATLDKAIDTITNSRAAMGAYQNRLTASISNLQTSSLNLEASRSRILDTDYAKETTSLAKSQIISQAATAMLAQANQSGQSVLALLK